MERLLKWLDDLDDALAMVRAHAPAVIVTLVLLACFLAAIGAAFVFGPPTLLAAP
jgi:hypothetical protein